MLYISWLVLPALCLPRAASMQVVPQSIDARRMQPLEDGVKSLDAELQGEISEAIAAVAEDQQLIDDERAVFMQDSLTVSKVKPKSHRQVRLPEIHSAWQLVAEDLVQNKFGDNSSAARGLRTLLNEAKAAEVSIADWRGLALAIASLTPKDMKAKKAGPSYAFPARHVAGPVRVEPVQHQAAFQQGQAAGLALESDDSSSAAWSEWTFVCIVGLCLILLTSVITANKRSQPGKISLLLELETRWKLTGSSTAGSLALLRQAAEAQQESPVRSKEDLSVWDGTVAVFSCIVSTGLLAMPYAFSLAGMIAAPLIIFFVCASAYTGHLMIWSMQAEAARQCLPSGCKTARAVSLDWGSLVKSAFGQRAKGAVETFLVVELWGYLLSTVVCSSMNIAQLFQQLDVSAAIGLSVAGAYGLTFVSTKTLTKVNVISNLIFVACCLMFLVTGLMLPQKAPSSEVQMVKPHGILAAAGILVYSPAGHSFYPSLLQKMEEPSQFPTCIRRAYVAACVVYLAVAMPGYYLFGNAAQPSAVRNIGVDLHLMPLPDLGWMNVAAELGMVLKLVPNQALVLAPLTNVIKGLLATRLSDTSMDVARPVVAPMVLLVSALVAAHFANEMALLLNLMGSFFCMNIAFVIPVLCYWRLAPKPLSFSKQLISVGLVLMGLTFAVLGVLSGL